MKLALKIRTNTTNHSKYTILVKIWRQTDLIKGGLVIAKAAKREPQHATSKLHRQSNRQLTTLQPATTTAKLFLPTIRILRL
jgi:hypothetical protein